MAKTTIQPLFDNVLIKPLEAEKKTASGIILPDSSKEKPQMGEVMAVGTGSSCSKNDDGCVCGGCDSCGSDMVVKVGDKVLYKKWGGTEVKVENEEWMILEQKDILALVK